MAIASKPKPKTDYHKKRTALHHRQTKRYHKSYWPYLPMLAVIAGGIVTNSFLSHQTAVLGADSDFSQQTLLDRTNQDRGQANEPELTLNPQLRQAAQAKAINMTADNYWTHASDDGRQPWDFITAAGYQYQTAGENLAYGFTSADGVLQGWLHSPEHRANLLNDRYSQVGFGIAQSANYLNQGPKTVVVALYASPASGAPKTPVTNRPLVATPVSRLQTIAPPLLSGLVLGVIGGVALMSVFVRHGLAWRRVVSRGELFVVQHPFIDMVCVGLAVVAVVANQTAGFIR